LETFGRVRAAEDAVSLSTERTLAAIFASNYVARPIDVVQRIFQPTACFLGAPPGDESERTPSAALAFDHVIIRLISMSIFQLRPKG
jgi:hypothetical protein